MSSTHSTTGWSAPLLFRKQSLVAKLASRYQQDGLKTQNRDAGMNLNTFLYQVF